jgi:glycosyltransferase involved in cell wall biosynthesis
LANQLAKDYKLKIIVYTWGIHDKVDWGSWDERINIRIVPYSRYFQKLIAKIFYYLWVIIDRPDNIILNFLYHGETAISGESNFYYVLHSPASLIPHRYEYIQEQANKFNQLLFIAVSDYVKQDALPYFGKIKIEVIYHGIDLNRFNHSIDYQNNGKIKLLTISALEKWKGIQDLICILADDDLKNTFEYYIVGDGPYKQKLIGVIDNLNLSSNVHLLGSKDRIESLLPNYDIYCNLSDGEAFGLSLIEAMAYGLPAIVYDIPPFDSLIPTHAAKKVKNKSQTMLKEHLIDLADKDERERIGKNGRNYVRENYSVEKMASNYYNLFIGRA